MANPNSSPGKPHESFPSPMGAVLLSIAGLFAVWFVASLVLSTGLLEESSMMAAMGVGYALGLGAIATLAAKRVPEPHAARLGLQGFPPALIGALICLLPVLFLVSEVDNYWKLLIPASPEIEELRQELETLMRRDSPFALAQTSIVALGIVPIVEGFFFFGVILQGLVARLGRGRGLFLTAVLYSLVHFPASGAPGDTLVPFTTWLTLGALMGLGRLASGSILPPIALGAGFAALHLAADLGREAVPIPGFNAPGEHTSGFILLAAAASVALGTWQLWQVALTQPTTIPIPKKQYADDEEDGGGFFL